MPAPNSALSSARQDFIAAIKRDTAPSECPRFVAVLDAMIEWSLARPTLVEFNPEASHDGAVTFSRVGNRRRAIDMWSVTPRRREMPRLELLPRGGRLLTDEDRAAVIQVLNAHAREELAPDEPLRITFGAMKNKTARAAVLDCIDRLLALT